jgi:hypothetical protein
MSKSPLQVIVLDSEKRFLEYTNSGMARKLLKEKKAKIFSHHPFAIKLMRSVPVSSIRRKIMAAPRNFTEYFKEERDIYVQNIANAQVSCEFPLGPNRTEGFLFPNSRDPINLTQHIPYDAIKQSTDFRKMLNRRPAALQLMEQEQYEVYFSNKAKVMGLSDTNGEPNIDAAIDASEEKRRRTADRNMREKITDKSPEPIHEVIEKGTGPGGVPANLGERQRVASTDIIGEDEIISPRVLHLCNQVKSEIPDEERMPASELLEALQDIPELSLDDYEYIRSHGYYKTVKKWAKLESSKVSVDENEDG